MIKYLKKKWGITSKTQLAIMFIVFAMFITMMILIASEID